VKTTLAIALFWILCAGSASVARAMSASAAESNCNSALLKAWGSDDEK